METHASPDSFWGVVSALMRDVDTPKSLMAWLLIEHREYDQLVALTVDPSAYNDPEDLFKDRLVVDLVRKCRSVPLKGIDPTSAAKQAWYRAEMLCLRTNIRLTPFLHNGPFGAEEDVRIADFLQDVRSVVRRWMGDLPNDLERSSFGPGATLLDRGFLTTIPDKMTSRPTLTSQARCLIPLWEESAWCRALISERPTISDPLVVDHDRFVCVPKDAMKHRGICVGPSLNTYWQLGVGRFLRGRLKRIGIDLDGGQQTHRQVACRASLTGEFATVDLTSASDTVSSVLVKLLVSDPWHDLLSSLRTTSTLIDGKKVHLQKFSAMGNGYTFELETLIFAAITYVVTERCGILPRIGANMWVYGDDILLPSNACSTLLSVLRFCGFEANAKKTFYSGWFRESCGGDFFRGVDVRPHFVKEFPTEPQHWITLANGLRRIGYDEATQQWDRPYIFKTWLRVKGMLPARIRKCIGPVELGDIVLHDTADRWVNSCITINSIRYVHAYVPITRPLSWEHWSPLVTLASALYGVPQEGPIPRSNVAGYRVKRVAFS